MSKDTPEVGDVWDINGTRAYIEHVSRQYNNEYVYVFMRFDNFINSVRGYDSYTKSYIMNCCTYLGKSKANIDDLFKTENEE